jgi:GT2 family glycosyltransferase
LKLSVIIVNYNVKYFLEQCLSSVFAAMKETDGEVIVVDNASDDGSVAWLKPRFPSVIFLEEKKNIGFAKANNKALEIAKGEFILFLNPDTILPEDALIKCIEFLQTHPDAGAVGVRMIDGSGNFLPESKRSLPTPSSAFFKLTGFSSLFPSSPIFSEYSLGNLPEKSVHEVDVLPGAFMMISKKVLELTGGFDEDFFMFGEDIDLSYRIQKNGFRNFYLGNISIIHFKGESTKKGSLNYVRIFYKAMFLFVQKHYKDLGNGWMKALIKTGIAVRAFLSVLALPIKKEKKSTLEKIKFAVLIGGPTQTAKEILLQYNPAILFEEVLVEQALSSSLNGDAVVFCIGLLSYKEAIELVGIRSNYSFKWHGNYTISIVSSDDKNKTGEVLLLNAT